MKVKSFVLPGVFDVCVILTPKTLLISELLPTFDLPTKANSFSPAISLESVAPIASLSRCSSIVDKSQTTRFEELFLFSKGIWSKYYFLRNSVFLSSAKLINGLTSLKPLLITFFALTILA